ncbi:heavy-metal-associated domain-containing protein [Defluviitalea saccharophila]|uniref:Heavy-metal-associated domain-containing protein n=1 Tax=Defluviitalea saccharophila TaxID=879970 RepID=A0ABZ2Y8W6_9FIRM|nr:heavy-metal-associated domain-containing protein [Candidatus Epulonipiscium sp.]
MNRVHYQVNGMQNENYKNQIKNALDKIEGVQMVNVDLVRGSVEVGYNEPADENEIKECIEKTGCTIE